MMIYVDFRKSIIQDLNIIDEAHFLTFRCSIILLFIYIFQNKFDAEVFKINRISSETKSIIPGSGVNLDKYKNDPRVIIIDIPYKNSKGACWARNAIQGRYTDQAYTLQLDSHHRFIQNWDEELIGMYQQLKDDGVDKPLLTGYISSFNPEKDPEATVSVLLTLP